MNRYHVFFEFKQNNSIITYLTQGYTVIMKAGFPKDIVAALLVLRKLALVSIFGRGVVHTIK